MSAALRLVEPLFMSEEEEKAELEARLDRVGTQPHEIDAEASELLGELGKCEADLARYAKTEADEIQRIRIRYEDETQSHLARNIAEIKRRRERLENAIKALAERQDFGSKKSRETANGTYGIRRKPAHLFIEDQDALLAWTLQLPISVPGPTVTTTHAIKQKDAQAYYEQTGCEMPGCRVEPEQEIAYAKPEMPK